MADSMEFGDFRAVITMWPTKAALAQDLGVEQGLVQQWWNRNSIPPRWFDTVTRSAIKRDFLEVTDAALMRLHKARFAQPPASAIHAAEAPAA